MHIRNRLLVKRITHFVSEWSNLNLAVGDQLFSLALIGVCRQRHKENKEEGPVSAYFHVVSLFPTKTVSVWDEDGAARHQREVTGNCSNPRSTCPWRTPSTGRCYVPRPSAGKRHPATIR